MDQFKVEATKFTVVGAVNFLLTFTIFTVMLKIMGINYLLSLLSAWVVGTFFSYILNFNWVFKPEQTLQFKTRFIQFIMAGALSIVLNVLALLLIVKSTNLDPFYVQMTLIPLVVIFNFLTAKFWSLHKPSSNLS